MLELTPDNAADYLRRQAWVGPGPVHVESLGGGVSNVVLRVETPERLFVLKQSRPQLRTRDAWFSDLDRVYREQEVMELLHPLLPRRRSRQSSSPTGPNYVFAMSHAPLESRVWKEALLAGEVDLDAGRAGGRGPRPDARRHRPQSWPSSTLSATDAVFVQLRVDPFYRRIQERRPEVADAVAPLIDRMLSVAARPSATATTARRTCSRMRTASRWSITRRPTSAIRRWTWVSS